MQYTTIAEGKAKLIIPMAERLTKKTADMPVFYNPVMKFNRDISVLLLNSLGKKGMQIADPLAGSGVRAIRFLLELKKSIIKTIYVNDYSREAINTFEKALKANKIKKSKERVIIQNEDANKFLIEGKGFDYIDIDPFGSPNPFLDSAIRRLSRDGILAVTATDTAALCGSSPKACMRKYFAKPMRIEMMHEIGLRILIRKVQLIAAQYDKALIPIFSYAKDHYMRVFLQADKSKEAVDEVLKQHKYLLFCNKCVNFTISGKNSGKCSCGAEFDYAGPLFAGQLWDKNLVEKMLTNVHAGEKEVENYLLKIKKEMNCKKVGFYDVYTMCKKHGIKELPKKDVLLRKLEGAETIFSIKGIKTDKELKEVISSLKI